jgi:hypothetical protein
MSIGFHWILSAGTVVREFELVSGRTFWMLEDSSDEFKTAACFDALGLSGKAARSPCDRGKPGSVPANDGTTIKTAKTRRHTNISSAVRV